MSDFKERPKDKNGQPIWGKPNSGRIFTNKYKKSDNHPDYRGNIWMSVDLLKRLAQFAKEHDTRTEPNYINVGLYKNQDSNGNEYFNLTLGEYKYYEKKESPQQAPDSQASSDVADDEIPF